MNKNLHFNKKTGFNLILCIGLLCVSFSTFAQTSDVYNVVMNIYDDPTTKMAFNWFSPAAGGQVEIVKGTLTQHSEFNTPYKITISANTSNLPVNKVINENSVLLDKFKVVKYCESYTQGIVTYNSTKSFNNTTLIVGEELRIKNNATVTFTNSTLRFYQNAKVVIEPGSKLIVNNTTLTNSCTEEMWQGITVNNQGVVELKNNATISNALCGITVKAGGNVSATGAHFANNQLGVKFEPLMGVPVTTPSSFTGTEFVLDNNYFGNTSNFEAHLVMNTSGSNNSNITDCTFSSTVSLSSNKGIVVTNTTTNWAGTNQLISVPLLLQTSSILNNTGTINVESGSVFTNKAAVNSNANALFTVHPKSKLIVDGGTFKNATPNVMWQGITVLGDSRYTGLVQVKNGGTIQNAITGVAAKNGGKVETYDAHFINNTTGVLCYLSGNCSFTLTDFKLSSSYFGATPFVAHIKAQNGGSITATACTFSGTGSGYGIWASNTNLEVKEYCSDPSPSVGIICPENYVEPSAFSGLNYGIYHISGGILPTLKVRFSNFSNCMENIYIAGTNFAEVIKNDFDITRNMGRGMLVRYATGYKIEENTFRDSNHNPKKTTTGMLVQGSGSAENEVYKNEYKNLSIGQQFSEKNSSQTDIVPCPNCPQSKGIPPPPVTGVQTLCNQFENNYAKDIFISQSASIRKNQGSDTSPAGNRFLGSTPFNIDNALSQHSIEYYFRNPNNEYPPVVSNNVNRIITSSVNGCPSKIGSIIINPQNKGEGGLEQYLSQYDEWNTQYEYWLKKLLITEPNSEEYLIILDQVSYYSALKDNYFNSIVVATMGEKEKGENSTSNIEGVKGRKGEGAKGEKGEGANETLRYLFNYRGHFTDNLCIVETYLAENNFGKALTTLAKMYEKFELPEEQLNELTGLQIYVLWLQQLEENGQNIYELSEYELNYLVRYVETNTGRGVVFARNILCELYGICLEGEGAKGRMDERAKGEEEKGEGENLRQSVESALSACHKITLVPNPTNGVLNLIQETINNEQLTINNIEIFDIYGKKHHLITSSSNHLINIVSLPAGIYFIKISTEAGDVARKIIKN